MFSLGKYFKKKNIYIENVNSKNQSKNYQATLAPD